MAIESRSDMALTKSLPFLVILTSLAAAQSPSTSTLQDVCGRTLFPQICLHYLSTMPESSTADTHHMAELAIRAAAVLATNTSTYISQQLAVATIDSVWQQGLTDCSESYVDAVALLDNSTGEMDENLYSDVNKFLDAAIADAQTCEDACKEATPAEKAAISKMNEEFVKLCNVILGIIKLVTG